MGYSRQEYWSGLPCPPPEDLPNPWIEPGVSCGSCTAGRFFTTKPPGKPPTVLTFLFYPFIHLPYALILFLTQNLLSEMDPKPVIYTLA